MKNKLIEVLKIQSESYNQFRMFAYIVRQLKNIGCKYYVYNGCIYATKGNSNLFPCIVSHMDTVHEIVEDLTVIEIAGNLTGFNKVTMEQTGIGGDDKVGIFIALQCLEYFDNIKAVFFRDEEVGCEGSYLSDLTFFDDCNIVLQCDRKGYGDFINNASGTKLSEKDFQNDIKHILKSYGYKFQSGCMTDVMALKESGINCAMANMSCGYYNPHSYNEYVNINDVELCLSMVKEIIFYTIGKKYYCKYKKAKKYFYNSPNKAKDLSDNYWDYNYKIDEWDFQSQGAKVIKQELCDCCSELAPLQYVSEYNQDLCIKCIDAFVTPLKHRI